MQLTLEGKTIDQVAIERIRYYTELCDKPIHLAYSGGKDSDTLLHLARRSNIKFVAEYKITGVDPYELVSHVKQDHPEVIRLRPNKTMWQLMIEHKMPPLRQVRYCCAELKEHNPPNTLILTGIRWAESARRRKRPMFHICTKDKRVDYLHPIIDWTDEDVWGYIKENNIKYCSLYDEGFKRLGCVLCPMASTSQRKLEMQRFPEITGRWKQAFRKLELYLTRPDIGNWEQYFNWWVSDSPRTSKSQCFMFDN